MIIDGYKIGETLTPDILSKLLKNRLIDGNLEFHNLSIENFHGQGMILRGVKTLLFSNCNIETLLIRDGNFDSVDFQLDCKIKSLTFYNLTSKSLEINSELSTGNSDSRLRFQGKTRVESIEILGEFKIIVSSSEVSKFSIWNANEVYIHSFMRPDLVEGLSEVNLKSVKKIRIDKSEFDSLQIVGAENLTINNSRSDRLILEDIDDLSEESIINDFYVLDSLLIQRANLGSLLLEESNLNAKRNFIVASNLTGLRLRKSRLPLSLNNESHAENITLYRLFQKLEHDSGQTGTMDFYRKKEVIADYWNRRNSLGKLPFKERFDFHLTHTLPFWTSRINTELWRPIIIFCIWHLFLNLLTILIIWRPVFYNSTFLGGLITYLDVSIYTVLPTHKLVFKELSIPTGMSLMMRISSAYFIYQIVTVSRKLLKRTGD